MPVEKRNRQQLDLDLDTHTIKQDGQYEHKGNISRQLEKYPNRWSRISFAARNKSTSFDRLMCHIKVDSFREFKRNQLLKSRVREIRTLGSVRVLPLVPSRDRG